MSGKESKRSKLRRKLYSPSSHPLGSWDPSSSDKPIGLSGATPPLFPSNNGMNLDLGLSLNVGNLSKETSLAENMFHEDTERIAELMDAPVDLDLATHALSRGPNPYLDRCMHCGALRPESQDGDDVEGLELIDLHLDGNTVISSTDNPQSFSSFKLEIWTCDDCRAGAMNCQSFLAFDLPFVTDKEIVNQLSFMQAKEEKEELQDNWLELRTIVHNLYASEDEPSLSPELEERLRLLVDKFCRTEPHQLFLALETKVREVVGEIKTRLVSKLKENGCDKPELALDFTSSLLSYYDILTEKANFLAQYLVGLSSHLKRFEVTWELLNKHLFHSIAHNDPSVSACGPTILEQLRQGSVQCEKSKEDPYYTVRKRLHKFQDEMYVVEAVWRDCQQLIENYCIEEVRNTHKHVSSKKKSFISQQRQLLKDHLQREPFSGEAITETMRNLMAGHKGSIDRIMCNRCKRERCTCDECTITHRITCGIINSDIVGEHPPNSFNFSLDHTRNVMDITPPSMSSTTSSSGSVSPINIEDKLTAFYDNREEFSDALLNCEDREGKAMSLNGNDEDDEADDEDEGDDEYGDVQDAGSDKPHSLQDPAFLWEAMQEHHQEQLRQQHSYQERLNHHSCSHKHYGKSEGCPFLPPINPKLSRELEAELAKSGLLAGKSGASGNPVNSADLEGGGSCYDDGATGSEAAGESAGGDGGGDGSFVTAPGMCATCQCHACLKQSGHVVSTSLPLQVTSSPSPSELHLYPHIHGLPQQDPKNYNVDQLLSSLKPPFMVDYDPAAGIHDHLYRVYSDWQSSLQSSLQPRPGSLAAQHQQQCLTGHSLDLLPPTQPLESPSPPFTFDLASYLATHTTHTTHTSTTNTTSAFKTVSGKGLSSPIVPTLSNFGNITSEGSSVDPGKPLDFASLSKIPQSCLNGTGAFPGHAFPSTSVSFPSSFSSVSSSSAGSLSSLSVTSEKSCSAFPAPPCSRPTPLGGNATTSKWEKGHPPSCKKFSRAHLSKQQQRLSTSTQQHPPHNFTGGRLPPASSECQQHHNNQTLKNLFPGSPPHHHHHHNVRAKASSGRASLPTPCSAPPSLSSTERSVPPPPLPSSSAPPSLPSLSPQQLQQSHGLTSVVNNIGVGTTCTHPDCEMHHHGEDRGTDSVDDSCSEKSSSTTSQKDGKYCDCCLCEFFGHNASTAKISTNYIETKDRLRKILEKRQIEGKHKPSNEKNDEHQEDCSDEIHDPLEKKGLEGLLRYINGTDEDSGCKAKEKELSAKAAKRARQKQKKLEEKAKLGDYLPVETDKVWRDIVERTVQDLEPDSQIIMAKPKHNRSKCENSHKEMPVSQNICNGLKQEINRKSLIIESTRPTISLSKKDGKAPHSSHPFLTKGDVNKTAQRMSNLLGAIQQSINKGKAFVQSSNGEENAPPLVHQFGSANGIRPSSKVSAEVSNVTKSSKDMTKSNGSVGQSQSQQQRLGQQQLRSSQQKSSQPSSLQQPKSQQQAQSSNPPQKATSQQQTRQQAQKHQEQSTKLVNGKTGSASQSLTATNRSAPSSASVPLLSNQSFGKTQNPSANKQVNGSSRVPNGHADSKQSNCTQMSAAASHKTTSSSNSSTVGDSPCAGSGSSASQSPSCGTKAAAEQGKANGKNKKKKKNKNANVNCVDEIFMPKAESELEGDVDDFERELEEFKRFCFEPSEPKEKRKIAVHVNLKDIFKKKSGLV